MSLNAHSSRLFDAKKARRRGGRPGQSRAAGRKAASCGSIASSQSSKVNEALTAVSASSHRTAEKPRERDALPFLIASLTDGDRR